MWEEHIDSQRDCGTALGAADPATLSPAQARTLLESCGYGDEIAQHMFERRREAWFEAWKIWWINRPDPEMTAWLDADGANTGQPSYWASTGYDPLKWNETLALQRVRATCERM